MKAPNNTWWAKAQQARDRLFAQLLNHPDVSLVDIGMDPRGVSSTPVLRVHLRGGARSVANLPGDIDGIPIRVIYGDYKLQNGS
jgi:hypothetical protein